jgi:hypothetical protein
MKHGIRQLAVAAFLFGAVGVIAQNTTEPMSGLPLPPAFKRTADPVQSYTFCGKKASTALYVGGNFPDLEHENAWYARAMPGAVVYDSVTGVKTFITSDGAAAVEAAGGFISYFRFTPGLSPAEMKILGTEPAARACTPD